MCVVNYINIFVTMKKMSVKGLNKVTCANSLLGNKNARFTKM